MAKKEIIKQLRLFKKELSEDAIITKMIFFGSRARGKPNRDSDIDLIIVSPMFRKKKSFKRGLDFYKHWKLDYPVDFLCYTPEEFDEMSQMVTIVRHAVKKGIEI